MMHRLIIYSDGKRSDVPYEGSPLLSDILYEHGFALAHPCGKHGRCGKCRVDVTGEVSAPNGAENRADGRLSCQTVLLGDCEVFLPLARNMEQIQIDGINVPLILRPMEGHFGAAIDIGTTTLALKLYDLRTGGHLGSAVGSNPQASVAADVMGRIGAGMEGGSAGLQEMVLDALGKLLTVVCQEVGIDEADVETLVIDGNTTMLTLLTGRDTTSLSRAPFVANYLFDDWTSVLDREAYLPPCMGAFVGADTSCAVLASGICGRKETALFIDAGTNGEIALWKDGNLYVCSTAAGPAFEGAGIHMGCGSVIGAIDSVSFEDNGALKAHTIGDAPALGVCGSGLIDAVACLLKMGLIDETGATTESRLFLTPNVYLVPQDIRNTQLAKAAIAAGIKTLLRHSGVEIGQVKALYLAGGFGSRLGLMNAAAIGLIPAELIGCVRVIGNAALTGACMLLLDTENIREIRRIVGLSQHVTLSGNPYFNEAYMDEMIFPELGRS